ncbi:MAG: AAA family ATPase [Oscillospiraceae bacterium]|nr:AAA family ATPase [Oscillospiraceae bacterium]
MDSLDDINKKSREELLRDMKPAGAYLDSLSGFADIIGTIRQAENAANELLRETSGTITGKNIVKNAADTSYTEVTPAADGEKTKANKKTSTKDFADGEPPQVTETQTDTQTDTEEAPVAEKTQEELLETLDALVGLDNIKQSVKSLINLVKIRKLREENELPNPPLSLHMVFAGNPGTGKTTVARILSELYKAIGVLSKGQLVEVDRSGLVAGFVGQTAIKTSEVVTSALGGILFIDEAYALAPDTGAGNDFGRESIETLLKLMEDHRDDLIVIVAGYSDPMERFITSNPGLESRFNRYFFFEDYNSEELYEIFDLMCVKSEYKLTDDAQEFAREHFKIIYENRDENFGNARHVRNFFENIVTVHSDRVSALEEHTREDLTTIVLEDMEKAAEV